MSDFHLQPLEKLLLFSFCRNNGYAISTPIRLQFATDGVAPEGPGHGIETVRIDGNDFFAVYDAVAKARLHCIKGKGPFFIEAMTYRLGAHSTSDDPSRYRDGKELSLWEKKCPILRLRRYLERKKLWNDSLEKKLQLQIKQQVDAAIAVCKETRPPPLSSIIADVYFEPTARLKEQMQELRRFFPESE